MTDTLVPDTLVPDTLVPETLAPLIRDFLEWLAREPRTHADVMENWRTSCPRLPVWEEATDNGYAARGDLDLPSLARGLAFLEQRA